jgi:hypothetical protein
MSYFPDEPVPTTRADLFSTDVTENLVNIVCGGETESEEIMQII